MQRVREHAFNAPGEVRMQLMDSAIVLEVGPRDGLQMVPTRLSVAEKTDLIERAVDAGVRHIEIGSFVHPKAMPQLADTDEVAKRLRRQPGVEYSALVMNLKGVERAVDAGVMKVKVNVSVSEAHSQKNQKRSPEEAMVSLRESVAYAREHQLQVAAGISMAFGCPFEGAIPYERLEALVKGFLAMGVQDIAPADTAGMGNPLLVYTTMTRLRAACPEARFGIHLHDTRGLALANTLAALQAGVVEHGASFAGLGGCPFAPGASGNVATEDVVHLLHAMRVQTGVDLEKLLDVAEVVHDLLGDAANSSQMRVRRARTNPCAGTQA